MVSFPTQELTDQFALLQDIREIDRFLVKHYNKKVAVIDEYFHTLDCAYTKAWATEADIRDIPRIGLSFPARCCMRPSRAFPENLVYSVTTSQKMDKEEEEKLVLPSSKGLLERPVKRWKDERSKEKRNIRWNNIKIVHEFVCKLLQDVKIPYGSPYVITEEGDQISKVLNSLDLNPDDNCDVRRSSISVFRSALRDAVDAINECDKESGYYLRITNSNSQALPLLSVVRVT